MMSSSPSTPSRSAPATTASKRHSINVSAGPRPLHLVDGNVPSTPGPATAPLVSTFHPATPELSSPPSSSRSSIILNRPSPHRQSSISYRPVDRYDDRDATVRSPLGSARHTVNRSFSLGPNSGTSLSSPSNRRSAGFEANATQERPPLTLAEKHSELLHFIAQKESKCLELRSQLATHEAELLQLKRKWERIVSRGFENASVDGTTNGQGSGAVLEGIREGVQGVSRFLAAGLSIGELSQVPSTHPLPSPLRPTHSNSQSNSSVSTYATKSTRFSQSSASSLGEEPYVPAPCSEHSGGDDDVQILMVHDTGATPTMSPNPAFMHQQQQREEQRRTDSAPQSARSSFDTTQESFTSSSTTQSAKMHRRKSRDSRQFDALLSPSDPMSPPQPSPSVSVEKLEAAKAKRASLNGTAFPPVSSIPGLASLTVGANSVPVSSWVGSVGKKWGELQRGSTFTKSQKRASILLSDVSHSIVSALSPPPLSSASSKSSSPVPPSYFSPFPSSPMTASTTSTSLLDDDDTGDFVSSCVMTPDARPKPKPRPKPDPMIQPQRRLSASKVKAEVPSKMGDDEDEWNW